MYGIESDGAGSLWISTANGLARFDPRSRAVKVFHQWHGLQGEDFTFNAHYQDRDGNLFFGGNNGFNAFSPPPSLRRAAAAGGADLGGAAQPAAAGAGPAGSGAAAVARLRRTSS